MCCQLKMSYSKARLIFSMTLIGAIFSGVGQAGATKPKYGPATAPRAVPLSASNEYFRSKDHAAPDFWNLIGFYVPQVTGSSCSAASVSMVLNAARAGLPKSADDKVILQPDLIEAVKTEHWKKLLSLPGYQGERGVTLDRLGRVVEAAFKEFGFAKVSTRVVHAENTPEAKKALVEALAENEKSSRDFIIANFNQQAYTDDADAGHISPVGAYDSETGRVLILDSDREYYEPYWVSVDTFLRGMATQDSTAKKARGYVVVHLGS
jgi:hypothetical protein